MTEQLHPFQQDVVASGKYTMEQAQQYAQGQYDSILSDAVAAGKWTYEEAQQQTAAYVYEQYGFNFGKPSEETRELQADTLNAMALAPQEDLQKQTFTMAEQKSDEYIKEFVDGEKLDAAARNRELSPEEAESKRISDLYIQQAIRANAFAAPVNNNEVNLGIIDGLGMVCSIAQALA